MSKEFTLNPGEEVVRKTNEIGYGGTMLGKNDELILTTQSLVLVKKGMFGKTKDVIRFPLSEIVISNGQAQVRLGKKDIVSPTLDVYFTSGMESFIFTWEDEVKEWANSINTLLTGQPDLYRKEDLMSELTHMTDAFASSVKKVKKAFGIRSNTQVSCKCPSCGASVSGIEGETIQCPYCGSNISL